MIITSSLAASTYLERNIWLKQECLIEVCSLAMNLCSESRAVANTAGANLDPVKLPEIWYQVGFTRGFIFAFYSHQTGL